MIHVENVGCSCRY